MQYLFANLFKTCWLSNQFFFNQALFSSPFSLFTLHLMYFLPFIPTSSLLSLFGPINMGCNS